MPLLQVIVSVGILIAVVTLVIVTRETSMSSHVSVEENTPSLVLVHVPRSGGRSIECTFGKYKFAGSSMFKKDQESLRNGAVNMCCGGHRSYPVLKKMEPLRNSRYMIMLRDPATRIVSALKFDKFHGRPKHSGLRMVSSVSHWRQLNISEYIESKSKRRNIAVSMLVGLRSTVDPADLVTAKKILVEHDFIVGIFENFTNTLKVIAEALGVSMKQYIACTNYIDSSLDIVEEDIHALRRLHTLDFELYEYGRQIFERQYRQYALSLDDSEGTPSNTKCIFQNNSQCLHPTQKKQLDMTYPMGSAVDYCHSIQPCPELVCWQVCNLG
eukprot:m.344828 g.344828  ORF g.344828 m.344828 type:complete len:327 (+) comp25237_c0_seq1:296-1276(+)